ncbi:MAG: T9SS type A sorting domain-containing protein [Saprospiraceae bacterium]|nr:T9SS type A sorting domain-containing protein [Saprospiraceae bacterium]
MHNIRRITLFLLLLKGSLAFSQTSIKVFYYSGSIQTFDVATTGKLYFASDNLYIKIDGSTTPTTIPVSIIRKIVFTENTTGVVSVADAKKVVLSPNPSSDFFKITSDYTEGMSVKVYSLTGQLVHQGIYVNDQNVDVSGLSAGLYLVQVNQSTFKFVKK